MITQVSPRSGSLHSAIARDQTVRDEREARNQLKEIELLCRLVEVLQ